MASSAASAARTISTRAPEARRTGSVAVSKSGSGDASRTLSGLLVGIFNDLNGGCIGDG